MSKLSFLSSHGINLSRKSSLNTPTRSNSSTNSPNPKQGLVSKNNKSFRVNIHEMKKVFDKYDRNKDGKVSKEEYKAMLRAVNGEEGRIGNTEAEVSQAFKVADKDGDGYIDFKEFMNLHEINKVNVKDIHDAFGVFDYDGDGKISAKELMEVLRKMRESCSLESCKRMIREFDKDGDGFIDIHEFTNMMTSTMKLFTN